MTTSTQQSQFPCRNCGAILHFEPGQAALKCPYCRTENAIAIGDVIIEELDYRTALTRLAASSETHDAVAVKCSACGADSEFSANVTADHCPFCGSAIVAQARCTKAIKPRSLLPFHVSQMQATQAFRDWIRSLWFAPGDLHRYAERGRIGGVYIPYWTFDADAHSHYTGQRGDNYTTTETYTAFENGKSVTRTRTVTKTRWRFVSGAVFDCFDDLLIVAADSLPEKYTRRLEPWDLANLVPYRDEYLAGFIAESYSIDLQAGFERARQLMDEQIRASIRRDIGGDHQRIHSVKTRYDNITFKHILLPLWISAYRYRDKSYRFLVNARTGEICGERPYSVWKILLLILLILAIVGAIAFFHFGGGSSVF